MVLEEKRSTVAQDYLQSCFYCAIFNLFKESCFAVVVVEQDFAWRLKKLPNTRKDVIGEFATDRYCSKEGGKELLRIEKRRRENDAGMDSTYCLTQSCQIEGIAIAIFGLLLCQLFSPSDPYHLSIHRKLYLKMIYESLKQARSFGFNFNHYITLFLNIVML